MVNNVKMNWKDINMESVEMNSPYAVYPGESLVKILSKLSRPRRVELNQLQAHIIEATNLFLVLTSKLLTSYLNLRGINVQQRTIQKELVFLSENTYLNKYEFRHPESGSYSSYKCYTVGRKGMGFLASTGVRAQKMGYLDKCSPAQVKRILSSNQALIALMEEGMISGEGMSIAKIVTDDGFHLFENPYIFRASGYAESEADIIVIEPVRNENNYGAILLKKLKRMDKTLGRDKCNIDTSKKVKVIIVAESLMKMQELMNIIDETVYKRFEVQYSYDTLMYSNSECKLYKKSDDMKYVEPLLAV